MYDSNCSKFVTAIFVLLTFISSSALANQLPTKISFQRILEKYDVALGSVEAIVQDQQGYIWIGGDGGLLRYDGYDLRLMDQVDDSGNQVRGIADLLVDKRGILWISTNNGLVRYVAAEEKFIRHNNRKDSKLKLSAIYGRHLAELPNGNLLFATGGGLTIIDIENETTQILKQEANNPNSLQSSALWAVAVDKNGDVWTGGDQGVDKIHLPTRKITHFRAKSNDDLSLTDDRIFSITVDARGDVWIGTSMGLNRYSMTTNKITQYVRDPKNPDSLNADNVRRVFEDSKGILWVGTDKGGLSYLNPKLNQFYSFKFSPGASDSINSNVVRAIFEDKSGDLWVGNFPTGVNYYNRSTASSAVYQSTPGDTKSLRHNSVKTFSADPAGNFWIGMEDGGLDYFDRKTDSFTHHMHTPDDANSISANAVLTTHLDADGILWAGTWGAGFNRFDPKTEKFTRYQDVKPIARGMSQSKSLYSLNIRLIKEDSLGNLWMGTQDAALCKFDRKTEVFTHYLPDKDNPKAILYNIVYSMLEDSQGRFWVGTQSSLELMDREKGTFTHFQNIESDATSISSNKIYTIYEDSKARVWFGTPEGLNLLQPDGKSFRRYGSQDGFANTNIRSIIEGPDGQLWMGTGNGISSLNPETGKIHNFYKNSGWLKGNFNLGAVALGRQGELLFGGENGFAILNIAELKANTNIPPVTLTDFKLQAESIKINGDDGLLKTAIDHTRQITLNHQQTMFSFSFAALNFRDPTKNEYAYRLEGFDKNWHRVGTQRSATFTNIDPGVYVFQVIASNNDGIWNEKGVSVNILILPPWWKTWWAYVLYALAFFGALAWIFLHQQYKRSLVEEQNRKLIALDKLKDDFIANTSHELRTPLNGIIGLADSLLEGAAGEVNDLMGVNLRMISTSGKRLASLVNDILDFSKLKSKNIQIKPHPVNLYEVAQTVLDMCAHDTKLAIVNRIKPDLKAVLADDERLQQILFNLVGNAIKFTHRGSITLDAEDLGDKLLVKITDTGIGIPASSLGKIFNSFEQLEDHRDRSYSGTGLGLAVTKQLVEAHGGTIRVESREHEGSCFSFDLPTTELKAEPATKSTAPTDAVVTKILDFTSAPTDTASIPVNASLPITHEQNNSHRVRSKETFSFSDKMDNSQFKILIVDDNPINRQVLINQLTLQNYRFDVANDGPSALKLILEGQFDLILLDIMMPQMSGYEVCAKLRETFPMEDLPVIFLTAKNTIADLVSGFEVGANDFLTKPISIGELNSRVKTHLQLLNVNRRLESIVHQRTSEVTLAHRELKILDEIVTVINHEIRIDRLLSVILNETAVLFPGTSYVAYWKLDEGSDCFNLIYTDEENRTIELAEAIARREVESLFLNEKKKIADNIYLVPGLNLSDEERILIGLPETKSLLSMAFMQDNVVSSILVLGARESEVTFKAILTANYVRLRNHIDSALSKARLLERLEKQCADLELVGLTDPLTGLKNRRFLTKYIDHDVALLQRKYFHRADSKLKDDRRTSENDFIFFLVGIDDLKQTNDEYGHAAGDRVLAEMQPILEPIFRTSDYRIRWGTDEFLLVARFCDREHASAKAEQLRAAVEKFSFVIEEGKVIQKTCSIGFACYPFCPQEPKALSWTQVIGLADLALSAVKSSQKNHWLGLTNNSEHINDDQFKVIMADPEQAVITDQIATTTNLAGINWAKLRGSNA